MKKIILAFALAGVYAAAWFLVAHGVEQKATESIVKINERGEQRLDYDALRATGFPFPNRVELRNPHIKTSKAGLNCDMTIQGLATLSSDRVEIDGMVNAAIVQKEVLGEVPRLLQLTVSGHNKGHLSTVNGLQALDQAESLSAYLEQVQELQTEFGAHTLAVHDLVNDRELGSFSLKSASFRLTKAGDARWELETQSERDTLQDKYGLEEGQNVVRRLQELAFPADLERSEHKGSLEFDRDGTLHLDLSGTRRAHHADEYERLVNVRLDMAYERSGDVHCSLRSDGKINYQDSWRQRWADFAGLLWEFSSAQYTETESPESSDLDSLSALGDEFEALTYKLVPENGFGFRLGLEASYKASLQHLSLSWSDTEFSTADYGLDFLGDVGLFFKKPEQARVNIGVGFKDTDYRQVVDDIYNLAQATTSRMLPKVSEEVQQRLATGSFVMRAFRDPIKEILRQLADDPAADPKELKLSCSYDGTAEEAPLRIGRLSPEELQAVLNTLVALPGLSESDQEG